MRLDLGEASWSAPVRSFHGPQVGGLNQRIPKGFRNQAQGCEERATLGQLARGPQPQGGCATHDAPRRNRHPSQTRLKSDMGWLKV